MQASTWLSVGINEAATFCKRIPNIALIDNDLPTVVCPEPQTKYLWTESLVGLKKN